MKNKIRCVITGLLIGVMLICPVFATSAFPDVGGYEEFAEAVAYVNEAGIMVGDEKGNFNPYKTVTRAEMATIICRMLDQTDSLKASNDFSDVPTSHWANAYVGKAAELGIVNGYGSLIDIEALTCANVVEAIPWIRAFNINTEALAYIVDASLVSMTRNAVLVLTDEHGVVNLTVIEFFAALIEQSGLGEGCDHIAVKQTPLEEISVYPAHVVIGRRKGEVFLGRFCFGAGEQTSPCSPSSRRETASG